jgi:hypothetical protein
VPQVFFLPAALIRLHDQVQWAKIGEEFASEACWPWGGKIGSSIHFTENLDSQLKHLSHVIWPKNTGFGLGFQLIIIKPSLDHIWSGKAEIGAPKELSRCI